MRKVVPLILLIPVLAWAGIPELVDPGQMTEWGLNVDDRAAAMAELDDAVMTSSNSGWSVALRSDGTLYAWGSDDGQFPVPDWDDVTQVSAGWHHGIAIRGSGTVDEWGAPYGNDIADWEALRPEITTAVQVCAGDDHSAALLADGTVRIWGGRAGITSYDGDVTDAVQIASSWYGLVVLHEDGHVTSFGQVSQTGMTYDTPASVEGVGDAVFVTASRFSFAAILADGTFVGWGMPNDYGQFTPVEGATDLVQIALGDHHGCGIKADGTFVGWGTTTYGQEVLPETVETVAWVSSYYRQTQVIAGLPPTYEPQTYYVRTDGNDSNDGSANDSGHAWLTIQKAATTMVAGDTVNVAAGTYAEHVTTAANGAAGSPIVFDATGEVICRGFTINHTHITVDGFTVADYSPDAVGSGSIAVGTDGDFSIVRNCTFGPGVYMVATDWVFADAGPDTITTATGGLTAAGFRAGMYVHVARSSTSITPANNGETFLVATATDTVLTLDGGEAVTAEGATSAFISGTYCYSLSISNGAHGVLAHGNTFTDQAAPAVFILGTSNTLTRNTFTGGNGWDCIVYSGVGNVISYNTITDGGYLAYNPSPDVFEHWSAVTTTNVVFDHNFVSGWDGVIGLHKNSTVATNSGCVWSNNVFADVGRLLIKMPNCEVTGNTFLRVAFEGTDVRSSQDHAVMFDDAPGAGSVDGAVITGNVFVACGAAAVSTKGWYLLESGQTATTDYNFVSGAGPGYAAKTGFSETNGINGGDPVFIEATDLLNTDGLAFTFDDGLVPDTGSPLLDSTEDGLDIGAYQTGSVYWASNLGSNANEGSAGLPWQTFVYAESQMSAGESTFFDAGIYTEDPRPELDGAGTSGSRIAFRANRRACVRTGAGVLDLVARTVGTSMVGTGWYITGDYYILDGFEVTGSAVTNDVIRVGAACSYLTAQNMNIHDLADSLNTGGVDFVSTGPADHTEEGDHLTVKDCIFNLTGRDMITLLGIGHLIEGNILIDSRDDFFTFAGQDHTIRGNACIGLDNDVTGHPDMFQFTGVTGSGPGRTEGHYALNIVFENNYFHFPDYVDLTFPEITGDDLIQPFQIDNTGPNVSITIRNNIFSWLTAAGSVVGGEVNIYNNIFWACTWNTANPFTYSGRRSEAWLTVATNPALGETFSIGTTTYTFVASADEAGEVTLGGDLATSQENIRDAIEGRDGINSVPAEIFVDVSDEGSFSSNSYRIAAAVRGDAGNGVDLTEDMDGAGNVWDAAVTRYGIDATGECKNNIFVGCGRSDDPYDGNNALKGWFSALTPGATITADYNFVASTNEDAKTGFSEVHGINGGAPGWVDEDDGDFHLVEGSILIDAGATIATFSDDADGVTRPVGAAWDIGPFEGESEAAPPSSITLNVGTLIIQ